MKNDWKWVGPAFFVAVPVKRKALVLVLETKRFHPDPGEEIFGPDSGGTGTIIPILTMTHYGLA